MTDFGHESRHFHAFRKEAVVALVEPGTYRDEFKGVRAEDRRRHGLKERSVEGTLTPFRESRQAKVGS